MWKIVFGLYRVPSLTFSSFPYSLPALRKQESRELRRIYPCFRRDNSIKKLDNKSISTMVLVFQDTGYTFIFDACIPAILNTSVMPIFLLTPAYPPSFLRKQESRELRRMDPCFRRDDSIKKLDNKNISTMVFVFQNMNHCLGENDLTFISVMIASTHKHHPMFYPAKAIVRNSNTHNLVDYIKMRYLENRMP